MLVIHTSEYLRKTQKAEPEVIAWLLLTGSGVESSWRAYRADLQTLEHARPNDLLPKLVMLPRRLSDDNEFRDWFSTLKGAYSLAVSDKQKGMCLVMAIANPCILGLTNSTKADLSGF